MIDKFDFDWILLDNEQKHIYTLKILNFIPSKFDCNRTYLFYTIMNFNIAHYG